MTLRKLGIRVRNSRCKTRSNDKQRLSVTTEYKRVMGCTLNGEMFKDSLIFVDLLRRELAVCLTHRLQGFCKFFQSRSG